MRHTYNTAHEATSRLYTAKTLIKDSVLKLLHIMEQMQHTVDQLPESNQKALLTTLLLEAHEQCTFEDLSSQHIEKAIDLLEGKKVTNTLLTGPQIHKEDELTQEEVDRILKH